MGEKWLNNFGEGNPVKNLYYYKPYWFIYIIVCFATIIAFTWHTYVSPSIITLINTDCELLNNSLELIVPALTTVGFTVGIILILLYFYDKILWKYPLLNFFVTIPNLNGKYNGEIRYSWNNTQQSKPCSLSINQTASSLVINTVFSKAGEADTISRSIFVYFEITNDNRKCLRFCYANDGSSYNHDDLEQHEGTCILEIQGRGKDITLDGRYYNNRKHQSQGKMTLTKTNHERKKDD